MELSTKGLAKLGNIDAKNIIAEADVSQFNRVRNMLRKQILLIGNKKNVFASDQKHFRLPETKFASESYVSQFSHHGSDVDQYQILPPTSSEVFFIMRMRGTMFP